MANNNTNKGKKSNTDKGNQKKSNLPLFIVAAAALCLVAIVLLIPKEDNHDNVTADTSNNISSSVSNSEEVQVIEEGNSLVIPLSEISSVAKFYPIEVDGVDMEIIAVEDSSGNIRTAFNTCQICYSSGRGYYVQSGSVLVCQNCGNRFTIDQVGIESGGCNPWPIFEDDRTLTDESIEISYDFLSESEKIFANWKAAY